VPIIAKKVLDDFYPGNGPEVLPFPDGKTKTVMSVDFGKSNYRVEVAEV
jgi:hypothetical protein